MAYEPLFPLLPFARTACLEPRGGMMDYAPFNYFALWRVKVCWGYFAEMKIYARFPLFPLFARKFCLDLVSRIRKLRAY